MFPFDLEENESVQMETEDHVLREYEINFETGQLTGRMVEGIEALKSWIWLALRVKRYQYEILSWDYGSELEELMNKGYSLERIEEEAKHMIEECLSQNSYITGIQNLSCEIETDKLVIHFTVESKLGKEEFTTYV